MHLKSLFSASLSLAYLSGTTAAATDLDLISSPSLYESNLIKRTGWSTFDTRQEPSPLTAPPTDPNPNDPNAPRLVQIVKVSDANGTLKFSPEKVKANKGDVIQFHFYPKNHTITESLFAQPCMPLPAANSTETRPGQKSGFVPVAADAQFRPIYNMILNDTKPMWIFCGQTPHCQKGMVMVINQNETDTVKTLENYRAAAMALPVPAPAGGAPAPAGGSSSAAGGYGAPSSAPPAGPPAATATSAASMSTQVPAGPSLVGSSTAAGGVPTASIAPFTGGAVRDLQVWGSTWSVGLVAAVGVGIGFWM